jgi:hypothetical protein
MDNNYTEKSVTEILSQITYDILNIWWTMCDLIENSFRN